VSDELLAAGFARYDSLVAQAKRVTEAEARAENAMDEVVRMNDRYRRLLHAVAEETRCLPDVRRRILEGGK